MRFELKPISVESIPEALAKVERYRLLNEPNQAESICLDILTVDPNHQDALVMLLLSRADQFGAGASADSAREVLKRLTGEYERAYYAGIIWERLAHSQLRQRIPGSNPAAYHLLRQAMTCYEQAEPLRPAGNDDAILRWNTCARVIMANPELRPMPQDELQPVMSE